MRTSRIPVKQRTLKKIIGRCRERGILIPTFAQQKNPSLIPDAIKRQLKKIGMQELHPLNLFRISWKNDPKSGGFHDVNCIEIPSQISGVPTRIFGLVGKHFPTGAHKVGASFGCLVPRMVTGTFDPTNHKAVWPSTGNYCRGGAYNSKLLGCHAIAILPQGMSRERFDWLKSIGSEIIATPGCESNVKEIYDKCNELKRTRDDVVILNQFEEFGNGMWHYQVTAAAIDEVLKKVMGATDRFAGFVSATGSAGTIAAGDRLKELYPNSKIIASEALQCPTLLENGFGDHRIEGIGDKHVPWIHNVRNTDLVVAIDDADPLALLRLFNEPVGRVMLIKHGVPPSLVSQLGLLGISGIANLLSCIKVAKRLQLDQHDILFTVFTDSMDLYGSRLEEAEKSQGRYSERQAAIDLQLHLNGQNTEHMLELDVQGRRRIHNLKYFTWVEQQGKDVEELRAQWDEHHSYWPLRWRMADEYDKLISALNQKTGLLKKYK